MNIFTIGAVTGTTFGERESIFEDSDRFEEESLDSTTSDQDMSHITWRGWNQSQAIRVQAFNDLESGSSGKKELTAPETLLEICSRKVAEHFPFEAIERYNEPIPVDVQLRISFWSFPSAASDIRLYSCLANGNSDEFCKGESISASRNAVSKILQIGFYLSGQIRVPSALSTLANLGKSECLTVSVTFDRKRITHTNCACQSEVQWCRHVVALCLYRIEHPLEAEVRAPVSESLSRLQRDQLQKFAQYLISELPTQVLPTAQRLLDQLCGYAPSDIKIPVNQRQEADSNLLSPSSMPINLIQGAPDPTAGSSIDDVSMWTLDEDKLSSKLKRTLLKFVQIMPASVSDFGQVYPQSATPPASSEFNTLLRPIRGKEPEPVWNLLSIIRELCSRQDPNAMLLLDIITQQCVNIDSLVIWWFTSRTAAHYYPNSATRTNAANSNRNRTSGSVVSSTVAGQQCCATLMDEIVDLWTLLLLNPRLGVNEKASLVQTMRLYHVFCIHKIQTNQGTSLQFKRNELRNFQGFKPVIKAAMSEFPAQFYTESMFKYNNPVILSSSQLLYTYPRVNNVIETAQGIHETMLKKSQLAAAAAEQARQASELATGSVEGQNISSEMLMDDEDDYYDQDEDLNQSIEGVDATAFQDGELYGFENRVESGGGERLGLINQHQSDSIDEGLDTSSRRASITSSGLRNSYGANLDFPPITHFNAFLGNEASNEASSSSSQRGGNQSASDSLRAPLDDHDNEDLQRRGRQLPTVVGISGGVSAGKGKLSASKSVASGTNVKSGKNRVFDIFADLVPIKCNIELLHLLMESLHAHNFREQAFAVATELADALVNNCPDLLADPPPHTRFRRKIRYELSARACQILQKIVSVVNVLSEKAELKTQAFKLGVCGLEIARLPSPSKMFEVKMYHLETVILGQLRAIPCGLGEIQILREKAQYLADFSHFRGRYLLPTHLAMVIFENLCCNDNNHANATSGSENSSDRKASDLEVGVKATLAVLAMKPQVAEADNPLLCESLRRARSELTLSLLLKFRNEPKLLRDILNALLDQGPRRVDLVVTMSSGQSGPQRNKVHRSSSGKAPALTSQMPVNSQFIEEDFYDFVMDSSESRSDSPFRQEDNAACTSADGNLNQIKPQMHKGFRIERIRSTSSGSDSNAMAAAAQANIPPAARRAAKRTSNVRSNSHKDYSSERFVTYVTVPEGNRGTNGGISNGSNDLHSVRALALSSAENAASCNISMVPASSTNTNSKMAFPLGRRWFRGKKCYSNVPVVPNQPSEAQAHSLMELAKQVLVKASFSNPSTSSSAHSNSAAANLTSSTFASHFTDPTSFYAQNRSAGDQTSSFGPIVNNFVSDNSNATTNLDNQLGLGAVATSTTQTDTTQALDAFQTFSFANPLNNSTYTGFPQISHVNHTSVSASSRKVHPGLHMAAFEIGLHALCVLNCVSSNWLSRTYSTYESWIQTQTFEIGTAALTVLRDRWVGILTPSEACGIAQRAAKVYESSVRNAGADLALSVLRHANSLNANEIVSCLEQCNEQGSELLEKACKCIEGVHEVASPVSGSTLAPPILFKIAKYFKNLHDVSVVAPQQTTNNRQQHQHMATQMTNVNTAPQLAAGFPARHVTPTEEAQRQGAFDMVQQDLQQYLLHQIMFPSAGLLLSRGYANDAARNFFPSPTLQAAVQGQTPVITDSVTQHRNAAAAVASFGTYLPAAAPNPNMMGPHRLANTNTNANQHPNPATSIVTQTRFSKRAFLNGIEAVKVMIRRSAESKEEFSANASKNFENEDDLKWLISLTIQMGRPENIKILIECLCHGGLKNPFLMHNLTDFVLNKLQQHFTSDNFASQAVGGNIARQHCLFVAFSACTWQRYLECLSRKLETLGTPSGQGDEDLLQTVTSMRTCAITQYSTNVYANTGGGGLGGNNNPLLPPGGQTSSANNTVQRIGDMSRLIVAARNMRPDLREKIRTLFLPPT